MAEWWEALTSLEKIYWGFAAPSTAIFVILIIMAFIGSETDDAAGADAEIEVDGGIPFQFFTLKNFIAFFTIFGWTGLASLQSGMSNGGSIAVSFGAGIAMMVLMATMFYYLAKLSDDGTLKVKNAINGIGEAYLPIPAKRAAMGKVQIRIQGSVRELDAITDHDEEIPSGTLVTVIDVVNGGILIVKPNG